MVEIEKLVATRAKEIFERDKPRDVVWGDLTATGKTAYAFQERESPDAPTIAIIGDEARRVFMDKAREELKSEGAI